MKVLLLLLVTEDRPALAWLRGLCLDGVHLLCHLNLVVVQGSVVEAALLANSLAVLAYWLGGLSDGNSLVAHC